MRRAQTRKCLDCIQLLGCWRTTQAPCLKGILYWASDISTATSISLFSQASQPDAAIEDKEAEEEDEDFDKLRCLWFDFSLSFSGEFPLVLEEEEEDLFEGRASSCFMTAVRGFGDFDPRCFLGRREVTVCTVGCWVSDLTRANERANGDTRRNIEIMKLHETAAFEHQPKCFQDLWYIHGKTSVSTNNYKQCNQATPASRAPSSCKATMCDNFFFLYLSRKPWQSFGHWQKCYVWIWWQCWQYWCMNFIIFEKPTSGLLISAFQSTSKATLNSIKDMILKYIEFILICFAKPAMHWSTRP